MSKLTGAMTLSQQVSLTAREEASRWGHPAIDVDHLLLALVVSSGPAGQVLREAGVDLDAARAAVEGLHRDRVASLGIDVPPSEAVAIADPMVGDVDWSPRALAVMRGLSDYRTDLPLLHAVLDEPSGLAAAVLERLGRDPDDVRRAAADARRAGVARGTGRAPGREWLWVRHDGFVQAPVADVWALVADPTRRPEWNPGAERVELVDATTWDVWTPREKVGADPQRSRLRELENVPGTRIGWEMTTVYGTRTQTQLFTAELSATTGGTTVELTLRRPWRSGPRGVVQRALAPLARFLFRQMLIQQVAGISRVFR